MKDPFSFGKYTLITGNSDKEAQDAVEGRKKNER